LLRLIYITFCILVMYGFYRLVEFMVVGISDDFGHGYFAGALTIALMIWLGERLGAFRIIEPSKGTWIPHDRSTTRLDRDL